MLEQHAGRTVVVVSHVTPIKTLVAHTMGAPLDAVFRMELSPASVSVVSFYPDPQAPDGVRGSMRLYNTLPPGKGTTILLTWPVLVPTEDATADLEGDLREEVDR